MDAFIQSRFQLHFVCYMQDLKLCKIQKANAVTVAEAFINRVVYQFGPPKTFISDEDSTLPADVLMHI